MKNKAIGNEIFLIITAIIWGTSFVAQRIGMDYIGPFTFTATRFILGTLSLLPVILLADRLSEKAKENLKTKEYKQETRSNRDLLIAGIACGLALFLGISFQQTGLQYTSAGKAGFITALYIVLVPILGIFLNQKVEKNIWAGLVLAIIGLYLLSVQKDFSISKGDLIVLLGTVFWAIHILIIDYFAPKVDGLRMSCIQFFTAGILSLLVALFTETIEINLIINSAGPILYTGVVVVGIAYTFQILGQKGTNPSVSAIILSTESVFAAISGTLILGEVMSVKEIVGCIFMFGAVLLTQLRPWEMKSLE